MPPLSFTILNRTRCSRVIGSQTCSDRPSQPYITMPPNLTSSAVTPRSVAPPFPSLGAGAGVGNAGTEPGGPEADDLAAGEDGAPAAVGLADGAAAFDPPLAGLLVGVEACPVGVSGAGAVASAVGAAATSPAGVSAGGCSGAGATAWDWPASGALALLSLSEPPPHADSTMAAAEARATILELRIVFSLLTAVSVEAASRRLSARPVCRRQAVRLAGRSADRGPAGNAGTAFSKYPPPCPECDIRAGRAVHPGGEFHLGGRAGPRGRIRRRESAGRRRAGRSGPCRRRVPGR